MVEEDTLKTVIDELLKAISAKNIVAEPIEMEDKLIIPFIKIGMGFGTGVGQGGEAGSREGRAGAAGGGVGVFPVAVVLVFKGVSGPEGVKVVPLSSPSPLSEPMASISHLVRHMLTQKTPAEEKSKTEKSASHPVLIEID
ncbi:MAG: Sporulation protein YtfJ (Spore_YtfJ) [Methanosaeta sp. PtaU1.Bin060]|nr:MAG: Sporulation protein YtfJ (Spore_YtfJ) [Methanosaeta sp. PtaU1.Bin060]